jgi:hypothetical protein
MTDQSVRFELTMPAAMRASLESAATADGNRSAARLARTLIQRGLEPLNGAERATYGHDAVRSQVTGIPYEVGSGAHPPEVQDRLALAEVKVGRRLTEGEAQILLRSDPVEAALNQARANLEEIK